MSKKKKKEFSPVYYYQGKPTKKVREWLCAMAKQGITVYHQYGKPTCPNPNGCQ